MPDNLRENIREHVTGQPGRENVPNQESQSRRENVPGRENIPGRENVPTQESQPRRENVQGREDIAGRENVPAQHAREDNPGTQQVRRDQLRPDAASQDTTPGTTRDEARDSSRRAPVLNEEWKAVQYEFVDDPQAAVRRADELVTRALEDFTTRQRSLAKQLSAKTGDDAAQTEDLRLALHKYRELFQSLVTVK